MRKNVMILAPGLCFVALLCLAGCGSGGSGSETTAHGTVAKGEKSNDTGTASLASIPVATNAAGTNQPLPAVPAPTSPSVWFVQTAAGAWTLYGRGLDGIGGISLQIRYETTLSNPVVNPGSVVSGSFTVANVTTPGVIRFAAANDSPFAGSTGDIVSITFGNGAGKATVQSVEMATANDSTPELIPVDILDPESATNAAATSSTGYAPQI